LGRPDHYRPRGKTPAEVTRGQVYSGSAARSADSAR